MNMNRCIYTYDPGRWPYLTRCWTPVVIGSSYCLRHQNLNEDKEETDDQQEEAS